MMSSIIKANQSVLLIERMIRYMTRSLMI